MASPSFLSIENFPVLDETVLKKLIHDVGEDIAPSLINSFLDEVIVRESQISEASKTMDLTAIDYSVHALKSVSGTFGAARLNNITITLELACKHKDKDMVVSLVTSLQATSAETITAFRAFKV